MSALRVLAAFVLLSLSATVARAGDFCDGYQEGYKQGVCYGKFSCMAPLPPMCPMPRLGEDTYQEGYNRGFLAGREKS